MNTNNLDLESYFKALNDNKKMDTFHRGNFLSRIFGIFNEEPVRIWCRNKNSQYIDLGRPTYHLKKPKNRYYTYDFLFEKDGKRYVVEQKCEIAYQNYKYLKLTTGKYLEHHEKKKSFKEFVKMAKTPSFYKVSYKDKSQDNRKNTVGIHGTILIWGSIENQEKDDPISKLIEKYNFVDILSLERIISDLIKWEDKEYFDFLKKRQEIINSFFTFLKGGNI